MNLRGIPLHDPQGCGNSTANLDGFQKGLIGDLFDFFEQVPDLHRELLPFHASGKREYLIHQIRPAFGAAFDGGENVMLLRAPLLQL